MYYRTLEVSYRTGRWRCGTYSNGSPEGTEQAHFCILLTHYYIEQRRLVAQNGESFPPTHFPSWATDRGGNTDAALPWPPLFLLRVRPAVGCLLALFITPQPANSTPSSARIQKIKIAFSRPLSHMSAAFGASAEGASGSTVVAVSIVYRPRRALLQAQASIIGIKSA